MSPDVQAGGPLLLQIRLSDDAGATEEPLNEEAFLASLRQSTGAKMTTTTSRGDESAAGGASGASGTSGGKRTRFDLESIGKISITMLKGGGGNIDAQGPTVRGDKSGKLPTSAKNSKVLNDLKILRDG